MAKISKGYIRRRLHIKGTRKKPLTTKKLMNKFSYHYGRMSEEEKLKLQEEYENYDLVFLSPKELRKAKGLTNQDKRYMIERFFGIRSGEYQEGRKNIFISNYIEALRNAGVSKIMISNVINILRNKSPQELSMLIRSGAIPNAFIFYEAMDEGERAIQLESDLAIFITEELENEEDASIDEL